MKIQSHGLQELKKNSILEELLYANEVKNVFGSTTTSIDSHPYQNGMFISFSNYKTYQEDLIKNYKRQYQSILKSLGFRISRDEITKRYELPKRRTITDLIVNKIPILVAACHDNTSPDDNGRTYHHSHFLIYNIHHYLPKSNLELRKVIDQMIKNQYRYVGGRVKSESVDIRPVGSYKHYQDNIAPSEFYDYLQTPRTHPDKENLMNYLSRSNKQDPKVRYPFNYLYYNKNILSPAG